MSPLQYSRKSFILLLSLKDGPLLIFLTLAKLLAAVLSKQITPIGFTFTHVPVPYGEWSGYCHMALYS